MLQAKAKGFSRNSILFTSLVIIAVISFYIYNAFSNKFLPGINLGLDLKGGAYIQMSTDPDYVLKEYTRQLQDTLSEGFKNFDISYIGFSVKSKDNTLRVNFNKSFDKRKVSTIIKRLLPEINVKMHDRYLDLNLKSRHYIKYSHTLIEQAIEVVRRRVDADGTLEVDISRHGDYSIVLEVPGIKDPEEIKKIVGKTALLTFNMIDENATFNNASPSAGFRAVKGQGSDMTYYVKVIPEFTGKHLKVARSDLSNGQPSVYFRLDSIGAMNFAKITEQNIGRHLAILLDGVVVSAPKINTAITGGSGIITGSKDIAEAEELALLLRAGSLPVPLHITEERVVGPKLGRDSIKKGVTSLIIGMIAVFIYMIIVYKQLGVVATVALIFNLSLLGILLSVLGVTLSLPGIAGIILTVGMAVDANILVYERFIRERSKVTPDRIVLSKAFNRVFLTLVDSNITTLFTALFLFYFGGGPIKGFAITMILGIFTSLFCIMFITRMLIVLFIGRRR